MLSELKFAAPLKNEEISVVNSSSVVASTAVDETKVCVCFFFFGLFFVLFLFNFFEFFGFSKEIVFLIFDGFHFGFFRTIFD